MAANTFLEMTRSLRLYVPELPITLAEQFIRDRYRRILDRRDWSGMRREAEFQLNDAKSAGTVAYVRGVASATGTGTDFALTDINRQFKVGTGSPVYTITNVNVFAQTLTLDREIGVATNTAAGYRIMDAYVTPPDDFLQFVVASDPQQGYRLRHWVTSDELMALDPQRTFAGQPYVLADRMFNSTGQPQYEAWPYCTSARTIYYVYLIRPADLINDDDIPIWPLRSDVIVAGAIADVSRWPGTKDTPNPYFTRPEYWKAYEAEFEDKMIELERRDESIYMTQLQMHPMYNLPLAPLSASYIQQHAI